MFLLPYTTTVTNVHIICRVLLDTIPCNGKGEAGQLLKHPKTKTWPEPEVPVPVTIIIHWFRTRPARTSPYNNGLQHSHITTYHHPASCPHSATAHLLSRPPPHHRARLSISVSTYSGIVETSFSPLLREIDPHIRASDLVNVMRDAIATCSKLLYRSGALILPLD
ncbi:hypothetical protein J6590_071397 [Homalodisca vitripennis]|nr:hypothetical protein J6590_071397 [Homalodisca vitripennis]